MRIDWIPGQTPTRTRRAGAVGWLCCAILLLLSCERAVVAPTQDGYLAIVLKAEGPVEVSPGDRYRVRIHELSGTLGINDTLRALPNDTILRLYPLATYDVFVDDVPIACTSRFGLAQRARISAPGNTSIARFNIFCSSLLSIQMLTDGWMLDDAYVWRVVGPDGTEQTGIAAANDTVRLDGIGAGRHVVEIGHVAPNCIVTSHSGRQAEIVIDPPVSQVVSFRVRCSDPEKAPRFLHAEAEYGNGAVGWHTEVYDPDRDVESYTVTVTDCVGRTVYPELEITRRGLTSGRTAGMDTVRVVASVAVDQPGEDVEGLCSTIRFTDQQGNTTSLAERRLNNGTGAPPFPVRVNAVLQSGGRVVTTIDATDPDGDLAGAFISVMLADGALGTPDGRPDIGIYNVQGYLPPFTIPDFIVDGRRFEPADVLGIVIDLIDRQGNLTRVMDTDLTQ